MFGPLMKMMSGQPLDDEDTNEIGETIENIVTSSKPYQQILELLVALNDKQTEILNALQTTPAPEDKGDSDISECDDK